MQFRIRAGILLLAAGFAGLVVLIAWYAWPAYQLWQARAYLATNNLVAAEEAFHRLATAEPGRAEFQFEYAKVLRRRNRPYDAKLALERAAALGLADTPENAREQGLILARPDFARAEPLLKQALERQEDDVEVLDALADGYLHHGRWYDADDILTRWLAIEPGNLRIYQLRGEERKENKQYQEAASDFRTILDHAPDDFTARLLLAHCLLSDAQIAAAEPELLRCRQVRPDRPEPLVGLAVCATEKGDLDKAHSLLRQAHDLDPYSVVVLHEQGDLYLFRQRYDLAGALFSQILRIDPRDKEAHLKLAQVLRHTGDLAHAAQEERAYKALDAEEAKRLANERGMRIERGKEVPKEKRSP